MQRYSAFQCIGRTNLSTSLTQDAFRGVFALTGVVANLYIHWTCFQALATLDALAFVAPDAKQRKVAHGLQDNCYWADVLAESTVVLEKDSKKDSCDIIEYITCHKEDKHRVGIGLVEPNEK